MTTARPAAQPTPAGWPFSRGCCSQISSGTCAACRCSGRACSSLNPSSSSAHSISTGMPMTSSARRSSRPISDNLRRIEARLGRARGRHRLGRRRPAMGAGDAVVFLTDGRTKQLARRTELEAIGRHLALRDRGAQPPRRADQHLSVGRSAQSAAGRARAHERLNEHRHRRVRRVQIVRRHVAQRPRRPERGPAGADRGQEFGFELEAQVAFELPREAGSETILDEGRGTHGGRARRFWRPDRARHRAAARARPARSAARAARASSAAHAAALPRHRRSQTRPRADASRSSAAT